MWRWKGGGVRFTTEGRKIEKQEVKADRKRVEIKRKKRGKGSNLLEGVW